MLDTAIRIAVVAVFAVGLIGVWYGAARVPTTPPMMLAVRGESE
jgi:hypothetical protein